MSSIALCTTSARSIVAPDFCARKPAVRHDVHGAGPEHLVGVTNCQDLPQS